jgi:hypothetical protein
MSVRANVFSLGVAFVLTMLATISCVPAPQEMGVSYTAYCLPDAIEYSGSIFVYLHNPTDRPLTVADITLNDQSIGKVWPSDESFLDSQVRDQYILPENDQLDWYRVYPNPVPPGQVAEVILRLTPTAAETQEHQVAVAFAGQEPIVNTVSMAESDFALEYVGISPELDEVHIYSRTRAGRDLTITRVEIDGKPATATINPEYSGFTHVKVGLQSPWQHGSFHAVAIGTDSELRASLIRALPAPPPLGIMGNNSEREIELYRNNLFDVNVAFTPVPAERYEPLAKYGLRGSYIYGTRLKPGEKKSEPTYYNDVAQLTPIRGLSALWAYFLEDEPDGRYHVTDLPRGSIARDVERANQFCRIFDPDTPTYLQIDHGGYPRNMYIYGQIADYVCTHAYGIGRGNPIGSTEDHVIHTRAASRPRPFYYLNGGYCRNDQREFEPDEMRMEVYTALATGAKSLQWYPAHGDRGLLKHPAMWNAVGEVNGILHQVLPLLSIGVPVGKPSVDGGNYLSSLVLCGDKALVVILVNRDFQSTAEQFVRAETPTATVRVTLPAFMRAAGVVRMRFPGGLPDIPAEIDRTTVTFRASANPVEMLVIYSDESVFEGLRRRHSECTDRYIPMPEE